jgi:hypothetical protein
MTNNCIHYHHKEIAGELCDECGLDVDEHGNTEEIFHYCCFPDCGCDGARLCMAPSGANDASCCWNIEHGSLNTLRTRK